MHRTVHTSVCIHLRHQSSYKFGRLASFRGKGGPLQKSKVQPLSREAALHDTHQYFKACCAVKASFPRTPVRLAFLRLTLTRTRPPPSFPLRQGLTGPPFSSSFVPFPLSSKHSKLELLRIFAYGDPAACSEHALLLNWQSNTDTRHVQKRQV